MFERKRKLSDFTEEIEAHLQLEMERLRETGMSEEDARAEARRAFGNVRAAQERFHLKDRVEWFDNFVRDLEFAVRQMARNPGFAATVILVLALGIGANVAIFAFVDAALIKPMPYRDPARLVALYESSTIGPRFHLSYPDYLDWKKLNTVFRAVDVYEGNDFTLDTPQGTQHTTGTRVTAGFFRTLGVTPVLGRDFRSDEDNPSSAPAMLLSYSTWQRRFGGRQDVLGQAVTLSGTPRTIIGVLPKNFSFAPVEPSEFWVALHQGKGCEQNRGCHNLFGVARLRDGISLAEARADLDSIARQLELKYPDSNRDQGEYLLALSDAIVGDIRPILLVLLAGAALLLLVAWINTGSLLLVRSERRRHEIAVRGALGASSARLLRQFVTEGLVLAAAASLAGVGMGHAAMRLLPRLVPSDMLAGMPYLQGVGVDGHLLELAGSLLMITAALFALTPSARLSRSELGDGLSEGGRSAAGRLWRRLGSSLVIAELAVAVVLLSGAGLLGRSLYRLLHVQLGLEPDHLVTVQLELPDGSYANDAQIVAVKRTIVDRISALPGVKSVGAASRLPVGDGDGTTDFHVLGRAFHGEHYEVNYRQVGANFFQTLGARLEGGRYFTESDDASKPRITIINRAMATRFFPGENPVGKLIVFNSAPQAPIEIVGVVDDIKEGPLDMTVRPAIYVPFNQSPSKWMSLVVRTMQDERSLLPALSAALHEIDRGIAVYAVMTMNQRINNSPSTYLHRGAAWLAGGFASMALLLGVVGLYAVIAYSVSQRTREIGVRMALGAQRSSVYMLVMRQATWLTGAGLAIGLVCSVGAALLIRNLLFGVRTWDGITLGSVTVLLGLVSLAASFWPAHRAASLNPVDALRSE